MKKTILIVGFLLAGCVHHEWQRPGATIAELGAAKMECQQKATSAAPSLFVAARNPYYNPRQAREYAEHCRRYEGPVWGSCRPAPQERVTLQDVNDNARSDFFNACMNAQGWTWGRVEE